MNPGYIEVLKASPADRRDLFLGAARRLGTPEQNIEKDFWVCWTLDALFNGLPAGGPRLLFKGGTSLSKGYGLISRFSEDIDITVFRNDLGQAASVEELEALSGKKRRAKLDAIKCACRDYIQGSLLRQLGELAQNAMSQSGIDSDLTLLIVDEDDPDGQSLLFCYPSLSAGEDPYVRPAITIESGAKSALDPNEAVTITPYLADEVPAIPLAVAGVTTVVAERSFWDKVIILHGTRRWFEARGILRQQGQRVSRHYVRCSPDDAVSSRSAGTRGPRTCWRLCASRSGVLRQSGPGPGYGLPRRLYLSAYRKHARRSRRGLQPNGGYDHWRDPSVRGGDRVHPRVGGLPQRRSVNQPCLEPRWKPRCVAET